MNALTPKQPSTWSFDLALPAKGPPIDFTLPDYDQALEDWRSLLRDICVVLQKLGARFIVVSPEAGPWPVDVTTDLPVALEQMPELLSFLNNPISKAFEFDFYEQGIQRRIELRKFGDKLEVACRAYSQSPMIEKSTCAVAYWRSMISEFLQKFSTTVVKIAPQVSAHPWWKEWSDTCK